MGVTLGNGEEKQHGNLQIGEEQTTVVRKS
jgi:hypothetical protein